MFGHRRFGLAGLVAALGIVAAGTAVFGLVGNLVLQFGALFVSGLGFAPAMSALYLMVSREIEEHSAAEAFGWLNSAALVGGRQAPPSPAWQPTGTVRMVQSRCLRCWPPWPPAARSWPGWPVR